MAGLLFGFTGTGGGNGCCFDTDEGVVERRVEINCLARFRFSVLDMDGTVAVVVVTAVLSRLLLGNDDDDGGGGGGVWLCSIGVTTSLLEGVFSISVGTVNA